MADPFFCPPVTMRLKFHQKSPLGRSLSGFTLMEVMVAVTILAIALTAVFRLQSQSVYLASRIRFDSVAPLLAQKVMSNLMTAKTEQVVSDSGDFGDDFPGYTYKTEVSEVSAALLGDQEKNIKKLSVTVLYDSGVYRFQAEGFRLVSSS